MPNADFSDALALHIGEDGRVGDRLNEPCAEERSRNAKNDVRIPALTRERITCRQKVGLSDVATGGVTSAGNHKESVHSAVGGSVGAPLKPRLADRPILRDEPRDGVLSAIQGGDCEQRISQRARAASTRLRVAGETLVGVEAGSEAIVRAIAPQTSISANLALPILKERSFVRGKTAAAGRQRLPGHRARQGLPGLSGFEPNWSRTWPTPRQRFHKNS